MVDENVNMNVDIFFASTDLTGTALGVEVKGDTAVVGYDINLDVNILKNNFTPMLTGGLGFMSFSGDIDGGGDFSETDFSYNLGFGFRWEATENFLIKGLYKATWTKLEDTDENLMLDGISVILAYVY